MLHRDGGNAVRKAVSGVCSALGVGILLVIILAAGGILLAQAFGFRPMAVLSGSMEPAYHVGGLVFVDSGVSPDELRIGDTVTFRLNEDTVVSHRIIAIDGAARVFTTQGDANNIADAPVSYDALIGRVTLQIPNAGYALIALGTVKGFAFGAILLAALIVLFVIPALLAPAKRRGEEKRDI
jgi:signal peptidase